MTLKIAAPVKKVTDLYCDKLTFTYDGGNALWKSEADKELSNLISKGYASPFKGKGYSKGVLLYYPDYHHVKACIQWAPAGSQSFIRVDCNPAKLILEDLYSGLHFSLPGGLDLFLEKARVTRLDAATNLIGVLPSDLLIYYPGKSISKAHYKSGLVTSLYLGDMPNQIVLYDKARQVKEKNAKHQTKFPVPKQKITRLEIRLSPHKALSDLFKMENPYSKLSMKSVAPAYEGELWRSFLHAAECIGAHQALLTLDEGTRVQYRKRLDSVQSSWWNPEKLWEGWPKLIDGLLYPGSGAINCAESD